MTVSNRNFIYLTFNGVAAILLLNLGPSVQDLLTDTWTHTHDTKVIGQSIECIGSTVRNRVWFVVTRETCAPNEQHRTLSDQSGYITPPGPSAVAAGSARCPWTISVDQRQGIRVVLYTFGETHAADVKPFCSFKRYVTYYYVLNVFFYFAKFSLLARLHIV